MMEDEDGVGSTGFMEVVVDKITKQVRRHLSVATLWRHCDVVRQTGHTQNNLSKVLLSSLSSQRLAWLHG